MKPVIPYIILSYMEPSTILIFVFTRNKAHYFIWIYHVNYYKIYDYFSWVDTYNVLFTSSNNIYIYTYHPYRLYMNSSSFNKSYRCLIWTTWVKSKVNNPFMYWLFDINGINIHIIFNCYDLNIKTISIRVLLARSLAGIF